MSDAIETFVRGDVLHLVARRDVGFYLTMRIEAVLKSLEAAGEDLTRPILYKDSGGIWARVLNEGAHVVAFSALGDRALKSARRAAAIRESLNT